MLDAFEDLAKVDHELSVIKRLSNCYSDKELNLNQKQLLITMIKEQAKDDRYILRVIDEVDTAYRRGRRNQQEFECYFASLVERTKPFILKVIIKQLESVFDLISDLEKKYQENGQVMADIRRIRKSFNWFVRQYVDEYKKQVHEEFAKRFAWSNSADEKTGLVRDTVTLQTALIDRWGEFLNESERQINLTERDLSGMDLSNLDLTRALLNGCNFAGTNLEGAQCDPKQFLYSTGVAGAKMPEDLLRQILAEKTALALSLHKEIDAEITERQEWDECLSLLSWLECKGEMPTLSHLTLRQLQVVAKIALGSPTLNLLPAEDELHYVHVMNNKISFFSKTSEELLAMLGHMLQARNMCLGEEAIFYARQQRLMMVFDYLLEDLSSLDSLEKVVSDLPEDIKHEIAHFIAVKRDFLREFKAQRKKKEKESNQLVIDTFIQHLFDEPDGAIDFSPDMRLVAALDSGRNNDELVVDLRRVDLSTLKFSQKVNFSFVHVRLSAEQEEKLPWKNQVQRYTRLMQAIEKDDLDEIGLCWKQGLNVNHLDEAGRSPFMKACIENRARVVEYMLRYCGADPEVRSRAGWHIMESTARSECYAVVDVLKAHGVRLDFVSAVYLNQVTGFSVSEVEELINIPDRDGNLPLLIALQKKYAGLVQWLLDNGANVGLKNGANKNALYVATEMGEVNLMRLLLLHRAVPTKAMLRLACEKGHIAAANYLYDVAPSEMDLYSAIFLERPSAEIDALIEGNIDEVQSDGYTPLASACRAGKVDVVRAFLKKNAGVFIPCKGATPLSHAMNAGQREVVEFLVHQEEVSPCAVINNNMPPLFEAAASNFPDMMEIMLRVKGVDINHLYLGRTPLLFAARGNTAVVRVLLEHGASPFATDDNGNMALHLARSEGHNEIAEMLERAMLLPRNKQGKTPMDVAKKQVLNVPSEARKITGTAESIGRFGGGVVISPRYSEGQRLPDAHQSTNIKTSPRK